MQVPQGVSLEMDPRSVPCRLKQRERRLDRGCSSYAPKEPQGGRVLWGIGAVGSIVRGTAGRLQGLLGCHEGIHCKASLCGWKKDSRRTDEDDTRVM